MRFLLILLVLANLVLFLYGRSTPPPPELPPPVADDQIAVLKSLADNEPLPTPPAATDNTTATNNAASVCLEWGPIADGQLDMARATLGRIPSLESYQEVRRPGPPRSWLVSLGGLASRSAAANRANELRRQGFDDISIMEDGSTFMLSLGVFSSEAGAQARAAGLSARNISSIQITPRSIIATYFVIPNASPTLAAAVRELPARIVDSAAHEITCNAGNSAASSTAP